MKCRSKGTAVDTVRPVKCRSKGTAVDTLNPPFLRSRLGIQKSGLRSRFTCVHAWQNSSCLSLHACMTPSAKFLSHTNPPARYTAIALLLSPSAAITAPAHPELVRRDCTHVVEPLSRVSCTWLDQCCNAHNHSRSCRDAPINFPCDTSGESLDFPSHQTQLLKKDLCVCVFVCGETTSGKRAGNYR